MKALNYSIVLTNGYSMTGDMEIVPPVEAKSMFDFLRDHAGISVAAACLWFAAVCLIWPEGVEHTMASSESHLPDEKVEA